MGFAAVNVVLAASGTLAEGPYAEYAGAIAVMNWVAFALKIVGAVIAALTIVEWPLPITVSVRTVAVWAGFSLLALYAAGSVAELAWLIANEPDQITPRGLAYVAFFALGAVGFGTLAGSYLRRKRSARRHVLIGTVGGPVTLALLLVGAPAVLGLGAMS